VVEIINITEFLMSNMVLAQDQPQTSEAEYIVQAKEYRKELEKYKREKAEYDKQKAEYDKQIAEQKALVEKKIQEEQKKRAEEEARKKAEEEAARKKAESIQAEKDAIYKEYQSKLAANPHEPKKWGSGGRGGGHRVQYTNPAHTEYAQEQKRIYERKIATINVRESGVKVESPGTLSRTASNILRGKSAGQGDRHVQYQLGIVRLNQQLYSGKISPSKYPQKVQEIKREYQQAQHEFTIRTAKKAASTFASQRASGTLNADIRKAQSEELKRLGGTGSLESGAGIGPTKVSKTLVKDSPTISQRVAVAPGTAKKSQDFSNEFKSEQEIEAQRLRENQTIIETLGLDPNVMAGGYDQILASVQLGSGFREPTKPVAPKEPIQQYTVTSKDGKVRTFNSLETAQKFVDRTATQQYQVATPDGKVRTFNSLETAQKFVDRTSKTKVTEEWSLEYQGSTKKFATKEEAEQFIQEKNDALPYTTAKVLPLEPMYKFVDEKQKFWIKKSEDNPEDLYAATMVGTGSIVTGTLNFITEAGKFLDTHIIKPPASILAPAQQTKPLTMADTYYDVGVAKALEPVMSGKPEIDFEGGVKATQEQFEKQTWQQNLGQTLGIAPFVAYDVVTLGQGGSRLGKYVKPKVTKALTPTLVNIVTNAPTYNTITKGPKQYVTIQARKPYQISGEELVDRLKITPENPQQLGKPSNWADKPTKPIQSQQADVKFGVSKPKEKPEPVKLDDTYKPSNRANEIEQSKGVSDFGVEMPEIPKNARGVSRIGIDLQEESQKILDKARYGIGTFTSDTIRLGEELGYTQRVRPKFTGETVKMGESSTEVPTFDAMKNDVGRLQIPKKWKESGISPNYDRAASDFVDFQKMIRPETFTPRKVSLSSSIARVGLPKRVRERGMQPNYDRAASDFVDFQNMDRLPKVNVVGEIKFSEGFVPNKWPNPPKKVKTQPKDVEEDAFYKPTKRPATEIDWTDSAKGGQPVFIKETLSGKIARMPKTGNAPITKVPRYVVDNAKTPKTGRAPIGWFAPKPKKMPNPQYFTKVKSKAPKRPDLTKDNPPPVKSEDGATNESSKGTSQILEPPGPKGEKKKKQLPSPDPADNWVEIKYDGPPAKTPSAKSGSILPLIIPKYQEKEKVMSISEIRSQQRIRSDVTQRISFDQVTRISQKPIQTSIPKLDQTPKVRYESPQRIVQREKVRQIEKVKQPTTPRPKPRQKAVPKFKPKAIPRMSLVAPIPPIPKRVVPAMPPPDRNEPKRSKRKVKVRKAKDFLGSSRTDHIVGLFKRTAIISGDKASARQLTKDKKYKENKKKKKRKARKRKKLGILHSDGVIKKGFKI